MKTQILRIDFMSYWQSSSGESGQGDDDILPLTEDCGLPMIGARTVQGLLRDAARWVNEFKADQFQVDQWFGATDSESFKEIRCYNATIPDSDQVAEVARAYFKKFQRPLPELAGFFQSISSTALRDSLAVNKTLRKVRWVIPTTLEAPIEFRGEEGIPKDFETVILPAVRRVGLRRHRGFGRCKVTLINVEGGDQ